MKIPLDVQYLIYSYTDRYYELMFSYDKKEWIYNLPYNNACVIMWACLHNRCDVLTEFFIKRDNFYKVAEKDIILMKLMKEAYLKQYMGIINILMEKGVRIKKYPICCKYKLDINEVKFMIHAITYNKLPKRNIQDICVRLIMLHQFIDAEKIIIEYYISRRELRICKYDIPIAKFMIYMYNDELSITRILDQCRANKCYETYEYMKDLYSFYEHEEYNEREMIERKIYLNEEISEYEFSIIHGFDIFTAPFEFLAKNKKHIKIAHCVILNTNYMDKLSLLPHSIHIGKRLLTIMEIFNRMDGIQWLIDNYDIYDLIDENGIIDILLEGNIPIGEMILSAVSIENLGEKIRRRHWISDPTSIIGDSVASIEWIYRKFGNSVFRSPV